jgi:hypothetical protein
MTDTRFTEQEIEEYYDVLLTRLPGECREQAMVRRAAKDRRLGRLYLRFLEAIDRENGVWMARKIFILNGTKLVHFCAAAGCIESVWAEVRRREVCVGGDCRGSLDSARYAAVSALQCDCGTRRKRTAGRPVPEFWETYHKEKRLRLGRLVMPWD